MSRKIIRWFAIAVCGGLVGAVASGVVAQFFIQAAQDKGYYDDAGRRLDAAMTAFAAFVFQTWFLCLAAASVGFAAGLWLDVALRRRVAAPASPNVYIGRVQVRIRMVADSTIGFYFIGLNNSATPMTIEGVRGWVDYRDFGRGPPSSFVRLSDPRLALDYPREFAPGAEFTVVVYHKLPDGDAAALQNLLVRDGAEVAFAFRDLHIEIGWVGRDGPHRLPIWDEVTCEERSPVLLALPMSADQRPRQRWPAA